MRSIVYHVEGAFSNSMAAANEIRAARALLEERGLIDEVLPSELVAASRELEKPLREALDAMIAAVAKAEGSD